jgi:anti-sigma regulatory factor (Ser/Thr protein kinase)
MFEHIKTLRVQNVLRHGAVEAFFAQVAHLARGGRYVFDMADVDFVEPCGIIALLTAARICSKNSGKQVLLKNLGKEIYPYLDRMDFFRVGENWLRPTAPLDEEWSRNAHTVNLLELTRVRDYDDVSAVEARAENIFGPCLSAEELRALMRVVSELCQNIYQHSGDPDGCIMIQKYYQDQHRVFVCLAVGDSGCGIRSSLYGRYRGLGDQPLDFIRAAMDGNFTSRTHGRGGLGLRTVRNIARNHRGYVTVRSETASVTDWGKWSGVRASQALPFMPGTQVSFKMYSSISS